MSDAAASMDRVYARQRHIYDLTRKYFLLGRDGLVADLAPPPGAAILEIGCGTGRNLIAIARRYPQVACFGLDVSSEMLATARRSIDAAGLARRIGLVQADASAFDPATTFGRAGFDRVVVSYALSMIPPWRTVLRAGVDALSPGGSLHIVDFGDQAGLPVAFKGVLRAWLARFHVAPRDTLAEEAALVGRERGVAVVSRPLFRGYAVSTVITRP